MIQSPKAGMENQVPGQSRACRFCRARKIKCDKAKPACTSCASHKRHCVYTFEAPKPRPSSAIITAILNEKRAIEDVLINLKCASPEATAEILQTVSVVDGSVQLRDRQPNGVVVEVESRIKKREAPEAAVGKLKKQARGPLEMSVERDDVERYASDTEFDISRHLSVDDHGQVGIFGLTSTLHGPGKPALETGPPVQELRNQLIANAALQRQKEFSIRLLPDIDGVPIDLAMHLLDLHWNRQHHTFLLTYRPAFMRDLIHGGPYCSKFLLNAIFACASKYSDRIELRDDPSEPRTAGGRFFRRCKELLIEDPPWERSSIPTVVAFLLLGSTFVARGEISKGWSYSGFAMRMVFDLGLHLDCRKPGYTAEDIEIRRRVYWGAFICDKLQSLYLGRPIAMQLRDTHVSHEFMDTMEELDLWVPYNDPQFPEHTHVLYDPTPVHSVSTFEQFCLLSKLMTMIINRFYSVGATAANAQSSLQALDDGLSNWYKNLPAAVTFEPWSEVQMKCGKFVPPNIMTLNTTYHSLVILLHRPFISDGHLRSSSTPENSWKKCTVAARNITSIVGAYRSAYSLRGAPYLTSYAVYVSCTIHVRNAALEGGSGENLKLLLSGLKTLDELCVPNPGVSGPANIIRRLMQTNGILEVSIPSPDPTLTFDMDAIPNAFPISSLFDTFANDGQMPGSISNLDNTMFDNIMSDSLFGFMDESSPQERISWN